MRTGRRTVSDRDLLLFSSTIWICGHSCFESNRTTIITIVAIIVTIDTVAAIASIAIIAVAIINTITININIID